MSPSKNADNEFSLCVLADEGSDENGDCGGL
jgi:hypothetical protein